MKKLILFSLFMISSFSLCGCAIHMPITGKLDNSAISRIRSTAPNPAKIAVYIDKNTREKVIAKPADGYVGSGVNTNIPIGSALSNALTEALMLSFSDVKLLNSPQQPENYYLLKIKAEKIDVGFEYSYFASTFMFTSALDKGRVTLILNAQIISPENKEIMNENYAFEESEVESQTPPPTKAGVLERCLQRIAIKFVDKIKTKF